MHPIVVYQLVQTRMDQQREAERRRLASSETPRYSEHPPSRRPPGKRRREATPLYRWIAARASRDI
jgi:hypothetical protein